MPGASGNLAEMSPGLADDVTVAAAIWIDEEVEAGWI
jgi:hypothetical protein